MATNQETAVIKARMDRIPSALSPELVERIAADRASGYVNPYRCNDDQVIRRIDRAADKGTLMRPAFMRDTEKILHLPAYTRYAGKTQVFSFRSNGRSVTPRFARAARLPHCARYRSRPGAQLRSDRGDWPGSRLGTHAFRPCRRALPQRYLS